MWNVPGGYNTPPLPVVVWISNEYSQNPLIVAIRALLCIRTIVDVVTVSNGIRSSCMCAEILVIPPVGGTRGSQVVSVHGQIHRDEHYINSRSETQGFAIVRSHPPDSMPASSSAV